MDSNNAGLTGLEQPPPNSTHKSEKDVKIKDGCRKKLEYSSKRNSRKPPLSYASLISLAISSTPQRMMTLSAIYHWIENNFPFYRTPEARAWKNSIRHNLSIRKGMFTKVHQYPPRRGNGSYWTLLPEGEEELKRAIPLFSTLQPPVIDERSVYNHMPSTYKLKSKGQFVPVVSGSPVKPYFALGTSLSQAWSSDPATDPDLQVTDQETSDCFDHSSPRVPPHHKTPHQLTSSDTSSCSSDDERSPALKRRKRNHSLDSAPPPPAMRHAHTSQKKGASRDHSLDLLDTSFLSPVKDFFADVDLDPISLSPLFSIISPKQTTATSSHTSFSLPSSFTPVKPLPHPEGDSGVFSPLRLEGLMFSTPLRSASIMCDLPSSLNTPLRSDDLFSTMRPLGTLCGQELLGSVMTSPWEKLDSEAV
ncbi:hypothetical protein EMCRGX_G008652 [Ephydatia muelleri]